jgi:hypothetical protein
MDLPMLRYEDDTLGMYYAFGFRDNTVTGASMYRSPDELTWEVLGTGNDGPTFGWAATVLHECRPVLWTWDENQQGANRADARNARQQDSAGGSELGRTWRCWATKSYNGAMPRYWPAAFMSCPACCAVGAARNGPWPSHTVGERFLLLVNDGVYRAPLPMTEISRTSYYKGIPDGGNWDDAPSIPFVFNANSLRCLSPVQVKGARDGSGNLTMTWKRRTRWYGEWQDGTDVPLFEANENYASRHPVRHHGEAHDHGHDAGCLVYSAADQVD